MLLIGFEVHHSFGGLIGRLGEEVLFFDFGVQILLNRAKSSSRPLEARSVVSSIEVRIPATFS